MQAFRVPARRGFDWLRAGLVLFRRSPAFLGFLVFSYLLCLLVCSLIPVLGQVLAAAVMPALSVGVMNGCHLIARQQPPSLQVLRSGFQPNVFRALMSLGLINLVGSAVVVMLLQWLDGGVLFQVLAGQRAVDESGDPELMRSIVIVTALSLPLAMSYWFAPLLCAWRGVTGLKAMFFSFVLVWENWRAFLVFACAWAAVAVGAGLILGVLGMLSPMLASLLALPLPMVMLPVLFGAMYANAVDLLANRPVGQQVNVVI